MPISLPYIFQNMDLSSFPDAQDSVGDKIGKALSAAYLDSNFSQLAKIMTVSSTPPTPSYEGQIWLDTSASPAILKLWDGVNWQSKTTYAINADNANTVNHTSAGSTPAANTIPIAGNDGKLDSGWIKERSFYQVEFSSSGSWTVPAGVTKILVEACAAGGGGGGGGNYNGNTRVGEGGYCGQSCTKVLSVSAGETITVTVGAGGAGGNTNGNGTGSNGQQGGNTSLSGSVSGSLLTLTGGLGGRGVAINNPGITAGQSSRFGRGGKYTVLGLNEDAATGEDAPYPGAGGAGGIGAGTGLHGGDGVGGAGAAGFVRIIWLA